MINAKFRVEPTDDDNCPVAIVVSNPSDNIDIRFTLTAQEARKMAYLLLAVQEGCA